MKCKWCGNETAENLAENRPKLVLIKPAAEPDADPVTLCCQVLVGVPDIKRGIVCRACTKKIATECLQSVGKAPAAPAPAPDPDLKPAA